MNLEQDLKSFCNCLLQGFQAPLAKEIVLVMGAVGAAAEGNNSQKYCNYGKANTGQRAVFIQKCF